MHHSTSPPPPPPAPCAGVRHVEVDIWFLPNFTDVRICHSPVSDPLFWLEVQGSATALGLGDVVFDPFIELCSPDLTLRDALMQVAQWLSAPGNEREVVGLFLDNRVYYTDMWHVTDDIAAVFGPALFTPNDLAARGGVWPTTEQFLAAGKRVFVESNNYSAPFAPNATGMIFNPTLWDARQVGPTDTSPFPNCTVRQDGTWYPDGLVRVLEGSVVWTPDYDERMSGIIPKPDGLADLTACGVQNIAIADIGPVALMGLVWSWSAGEPRASANCTAAAMTTVRGRWTAQPCSRAMPAVCRRGDPAVPSGNDPDAWAITRAAVPFVVAPSACAALGAGWAFDPPRDGRENAAVASSLQESGFWWNGTAPQPRGAWINVPVATAAEM